MKAIKYLFVGALLSLAAPTMAQDTDYNTALAPISEALKTNPASAVALAKNYVKTFKKNPEALVALGNSYLAVKDYAKAEEMANLALERTKFKYANANILLGDIEAWKDETGDGGGAARHYMDAMTVDPTNAQAYMRYASVNRKFPKIVEETYEKLRKVRPDFPIDAEAGHSFYTANKFEKAYENYAKCNRDNLEEGRLVEYLISAYQTDKKQESYDLATYGMNKFPKNVTFNQLALWSGVDLEKYTDAVNIAKKLMTQEGDRNSTDYTYYGRALAGANQHEAAIEQFQKALEVDKNATSPLSLISESYTALGNEDKALEYSEKYLAKDPNANVLNYANFAQIYVNKAEKGIDKAANYAKALSIYDQMASKFKEYAPWANMIAAGVADKAGNIDQGAAYNQKIVDELGNISDLNDSQKTYLTTALKKLGYYYWGEKNNLDAAKPYYEKLYQLDPTDKNAKAALGIE